MALLFLFRFVVPHVNRVAAGETGTKQNQGPWALMARVSVNSSKSLP